MKILLFGFMMALLSQQSWAHGEDKPGPHGGTIRMPGNFHTEVLKENNSLKVYLLDLNWKNPTVENSKVTLTVVDQNTKTDLTCQKQTRSFVCELPKKFKLKGSLEVIATRDGQSGAVVSYELPLKWSQSTSSSHSEHGHSMTNK